MTPAPSSTPLLAAPTPQAWLATHLARHYEQYHEDLPGQVPARWVTIGDVLADDAAILRRTFAKIRAEQTAPPNAAAKWLTGWYPGVLAGAVGYTLATAAAGLVLDGGRVRLRLHSDGWVDQVDPVGAAIVVAEGHPWAGADGVRVVVTEAEVARLAVAGLATALDPLVDACRSLARVGRTSLWAEVADAFGLPLLMQPEAPVDPAAVRRLQSGLHADGAPWRRRPDLRVADSACGREYLGRKAGCCLAYQCADESVVDLEALDERTRAFEERFPTRPDEPRYCTTCSLRDLGDCEARQSFWLRSERDARLSVAASD